MNCVGDGFNCILKFSLDCNDELCCKIESMLLEIKEANKVGFWKAIRKDRNTNIIKS
jgi:hypothetical protein